MNKVRFHVTHVISPDKFFVENVSCKISNKERNLIHQVGNIRNFNNIKNFKKGGIRKMW